MTDFQKTFFDRMVEEEKKGAHSVSSFVWNDLKIPSDVKSVLDVGCWQGDFLNSLPETFDKTGVDISDEALKNVRAKTVACSVEKLPFADKSFDLVSAFEVLEHLPAPSFPESLRQIERVSKKYIAISVPNRQMREQSYVKCDYCGCLFNPDYHVRSFDKKKLENLFTDFSCESVIECGMHIDDYPSFLNFLVPLIGIKPKSKTVCPQCGYPAGSDEPKKQNEVSTQPSNSNSQPGIFSRAKKLIRTNRRPYWLLAFYKRNGVD